MSPRGKNAAHFNTAGTKAVIAENVRGTLHRIVINSGDAAGTVEPQYADDSSTIALIAADDPDIGRVYEIDLGLRGLDVVIVGTPDVTVVYTMETP